MTPRFAAVTKVGEGLTRLAEGDLTYELREPLPAAFEKMRSDFNSAIAKMGEALGQVSANASVIHSGAPHRAAGGEP